MGNRLSQGMRFEGELLPLTPSRINVVLEFGQPDFLIVESVNCSSEGFWNTSNSAEHAHQETIADIVKKARGLKIPTVFWLTVGHEKFEEYQKTAKLFDLVGCAELKSMEAMINLGSHSIYLPPCVQPAIFNPFRPLEELSVPGMNIILEKSDELLNSDQFSSVLEGLKSHGLTILEPRTSHKHLSGSVSVPEQNGLAFSYTSTQARFAVLKNAKSYAILSNPTIGRVAQQWMSLEAAACRLAIVYLGDKLDSNDLLNDVMIHCRSEKEFLLEFYRYSQDNLYRERIAHLNWRNVNSHHTFSHRIAKITRELDLKHDWIEFPKASIITSTYRIELLKRCVDNYKKFDYPNKELVIVFNGNFLPDYHKLIKGWESSIKINYVPGELFAGASLNMCKMIASGKYIFRVDDDDIYGEKYIYDLILTAKSVNAVFFGKSPSPINFEGDTLIYSKPDEYEMILISHKLLKNNKFWLGGNSLSASSEFYKIVDYNDYQYGAADTELQMSIGYFESTGGEINIAVADKFNLVANRNKDGNGHTWRDTADEIISTRTATPGIINYFI